MACPVHLSKRKYGLRPRRRSRADSGRDQRLTDPGGTPGHPVTADPEAFVAAARLRPIRLRRVLGLEAEDPARVVEIAVAPPVVRDGEEDVEAKRRGRPETRLDHPGDVALTAPDREGAWRARPALGGGG